MGNQAAISEEVSVGDARGVALPPVGHHPGDTGHGAHELDDGMGGDSFPHEILYAPSGHAVEVGPYRDLGKTKEIIPG